jgi:hypothetical protein
MAFWSKTKLAQSRLASQGWKYERDSALMATCWFQQVYELATETN